ncbi:MAG: glycosyltransferase family 9 protein [Candidatus Kapaibacterium sp.]
MANVKSIAITLLGRIGDMILLTPAVAAIRKKFPDAELDVITGRHNFVILKNNPDVNHLILFHKDPFRIMKTFHQIRKKKYSYYIDPKDHDSFESRLLGRFAKASKKIGFNPAGTNVFDIDIPSDKENVELHYVQKIFNALKPLGIDMPEEIPRPRLYPVKSSERKIENFLLDKPKNIIVINVSAGKPQNIWPAGKWAEFIKLAEIPEERIVLNRVDRDRAIAHEIQSHVNGVSIFKSESMNDVISLVKRADLLISPDTSLVHVAAAFNIPVLAMYDSLKLMYKKFYPLSDRYSVIKAKPGETGIGNIAPEDLTEKFRQMNMQFRII